MNNPPATVAPEPDRAKFEEQHAGLIALGRALKAHCRVKIDEYKAASHPFNDKFGDDPASLRVAEALEQAHRNLLTVIDEKYASIVRAALAAQVAPKEPDMRAICEALGFDPTNHHNAAKCPLLPACCSGSPCSIDVHLRPARRPRTALSAASTSTHRCGLTAWTDTCA